MPVETERSRPAVAGAAMSCQGPKSMPPSHQPPEIPTPAFGDPEGNSARPADHPTFPSPPLPHQPEPPARAELGPTLSLVAEPKKGKTPRGKES